MKRFWNETEVIEQDGAFLIQLDKKTVKLPGGGGGLAVPFRTLADEIAHEWAAAGQNFSPDDLPLTRLATTAQDRVRQHRAEIIQQLTQFGMNDLLCYRAAAPSSLALREAEIWQPWIDWANLLLAIELKTTTGIVHVEQSARCRTAFVRQLSRMTEYQLAGLGVIVPALGSLVLGLAVEADAMTPDAACECAHLEEKWQEMQWGADADALARRRAVCEDVATSAHFMKLCRQ